MQRNPPAAKEKASPLPSPSSEKKNKNNPKKTLHTKNPQTKKPHSNKKSPPQNPNTHSSTPQKNPQKTPNAKTPPKNATLQKPRFFSTLPIRSRYNSNTKHLSLCICCYSCVRPGLRSTPQPVLGTSRRTCLLP